jgi:hypothetical protein
MDDHNMVDREFHDNSSILTEEKFKLRDNWDEWEVKNELYLNRH